MVTNQRWSMESKYTRGSLRKGPGGALVGNSGGMWKNSLNGVGPATRMPVFALYAAMARLTPSTTKPLPAASAWAGGSTSSWELKYIPVPAATWFRSVKPLNPAKFGPVLTTGEGGGAGMDRPEAFQPSKERFLGLKNGLARCPRELTAALLAEGAAMPISVVPSSRTTPMVVCCPNAAGDPHQTTQPTTRSPTVMRIVISLRDRPRRVDIRMFAAHFQAPGRSMSGVPLAQRRKYELREFREDGIEKLLAVRCSPFDPAWVDALQQVRSVPGLVVFARLCVSGGRVEPILQSLLGNLLHIRICLQRPHLEVPSVIFLEDVLVGMKPGFHHLYHPENRFLVRFVPAMPGNKRLRQLAVVGSVAIEQQNVPGVAMRPDRDPKVSCGRPPGCDQFHHTGHGPRPLDNLTKESVKTGP